MKIYGHPWSTSTRKTLMTLAEKGHEAELAVVLLPKGEQKLPDHLLRHPFGKVPVLDDDGFILYEARAINRYLDRKLTGPSLTPAGDKEAARVDQWINVADSYFIPHARGLIVEVLFRRYLGGPRDERVIAAGREGIQVALDVADRWLESNAYLAGTAFSLADVHWMPYLEYMMPIGEAEPVTRRRHLASWWTRVSGRSTWQRVARSGAQPYDDAMVAGA